MAGDTYALIREAVLRKDQLFATYGGHERQMCPHVLGTKDDVPHSLFYQFGGSSESTLGPPGSSLNWRCLLIDHLSDVRIVKGRRYAAPIHEEMEQYHRCIDTLDVVARSFGWPLGQSEAA